MKRKSAYPWKYIFSATLLVGGIFFHLLPAVAISNSDLSITPKADCPPAPAGWRMAIFLLTTQSEFPPSGTQTCVKIPPSKKTAVFVDMVAADNFFPAEWAHVSVNKAYQRCENSSYLTGFDSNPDWNDAVDTEYELKTSESRCPFELTVDGLSRTVEQHIRYDIHADDRVHYLYFVGFSNTAAITNFDCSTAKDSEGCLNVGSNTCFWYNNSCKSRADRTICSALTEDYCGTPGNSVACAWDSTTRKCISALENGLAQPNSRPPGYSGPIPDCAFKGTCRDINDLIELLVNVAKYLFGFIGTVALGFFVYGGFTIITSLGNSEKVSDGRGILTAAVVGIIIAFAAYAAVSFLLNVLQVGPDFRIIGN